MLPTHSEERLISRLVSTWKTALEYCALGALESGDPGSLAYDHKRDEVIYHYTLKPLDHQIGLDVLNGTDEVWVITGGSRDS